jgi:hypothetical protein
VGVDLKFDEHEKQVAADAIDMVAKIAEVIQGRDIHAARIAIASVLDALMKGQKPRVN